MSSEITCLPSCQTCWTRGRGTAWPRLAATSSTPLEADSIIRARHVRSTVLPGINGESSLNLTGTGIFQQPWLSKIATSMCWAGMSPQSQILSASTQTLAMSSHTGSLSKFGHRALRMISSTGSVLALSRRQRFWSSVVRKTVILQPLHTCSTLS